MKAPRFARWDDDTPVKSFDDGREVRFTVRAKEEPDRIIRVALTPEEAERLELELRRLRHDRNRRRRVTRVMIDAKAQRSP